MPIYEFKCNKCGRRFEMLCRSSGDGDVACPSCKGKRVSRLMSSFVSRSTGKSGTFAGGSSCTGCSSKSCSSCQS